MAKKLDDATRLLIESLPENLQKLAISAAEVGYMSQMDFDAATEADEIPLEEQDEVLDFFQQDLGLEILESDNFSQEERMVYGNLAKQRILNHYSKEKIAKAYEDVFLWEK